MKKRWGTRGAAAAGVLAAVLVLLQTFGVELEGTPLEPVLGAVEWGLHLVEQWSGVGAEELEAQGGQP